ncbi:hypothetical protein PPTG_20315, partial [Phytophthora nicotianae INRA-310]
EHEGVIQPVRFTGRVLHDAELKYHIAEKEVLAVIRVLRTSKALIEGCPLVVYTRYSVLKWVIGSKTADGRTVPWGVALSQYDLDIRKVQKDEDGLSAILGAGITPREHLDEIAESLIPVKERIKASPVDLVVVGDSRIVIQQVQGLINCNQPNRQRRLAECEVLRKRFKTVRLVHVKRDFNQAADYLTSKTLALGESWMVQDDEEIRHLEVVSRIQEQRTKRPEVVQDAEVGVQKVNDEEVLTSDVPEPDLGACPESNILNPDSSRCSGAPTHGTLGISGGTLEAD